VFRTKLLARIAGLFLLGSAFCWPGVGQSTFGSLTGSVSDPTGAVIAAATVTVTNHATQEARTVTASPDGTYLVLNLDPGIYKISVEAPGFKVLTTDGVQCSQDRLRG
jgi:hypothetical protein